MKTKEDLSKQFLDLLSIKKSKEHDVEALVALNTLLSTQLYTTEEVLRTTMQKVCRYMSSFDFCAINSCIIFMSGAEKKMEQLLTSSKNCNASYL